MADLILSTDVTTAAPRLAGNADLAALITAASTMVEAFCGRTFAQAAVVETYDGKNRARLWLRRPPILSVTAITINGTAVDNTSGVAWTFDPDTGELWRGNGYDDVRFGAWFPRGKRNVSVSYTGGYATIPADVQRATILTVLYWADLMKKNGLYSSERIGDYGFSLSDAQRMGLPDAARDRLFRYVLDLVAS